MSIPKQDERTPGGKNAPSIVEVARRGWDAARRSAKMTGLSSCGPWEELPKEMRDALTQVATEGWLQGTREGQDWARKGSYDNAPTDPHHGGKIFNAYGSTDALRSALMLAEKADRIHSKCQECEDGAQAPEVCEHCFPSADDARVARRNVLKALGVKMRDVDKEQSCDCSQEDAHDYGPCDENCRALSGSPAPSISGWQPIAGAPRDQNIIVAAMNTYSKTWIVGEAHWQSDDPDHPDDGDWWWANISPGDYTGDSIFNMNGPVEFWQLLPPAPDAARTALAGVTAPKTEAVTE